MIETISGDPCDAADQGHDWRSSSWKGGVVNSKQVKASQSESKRVKASQSESKRVKASQSKSKRVKASSSSTSGNHGNLLAKKEWEIRWGNRRFLAGKLNEKENCSHQKQIETNTWSGEWHCRREQSLIIVMRVVKSEEKLKGKFWGEKNRKQSRMSDSKSKGEIKEWNHDLLKGRKKAWGNILKRGKEGGKKRKESEFRQGLPRSISILESVLHCYFFLNISNLHPLSFILYPSSFILHPSSFIRALSFSFFLFPFFSFFFFFLWYLFRKRKKNFSFWHTLLLILADWSIYFQFCFCFFCSFAEAKTDNLSKNLQICLEWSGKGLVRSWFCRRGFWCKVLWAWFLFFCSRFIFFFFFSFHFSLDFGPKSCSSPPTICFVASTVA